MEFQLSYRILCSQYFPFLILLTTQKLNLKMEIPIFLILKPTWTIRHMDLYSIWQDMECSPIHLSSRVINSFISPFLEFHRCAKPIKLLRKISSAKLLQHPWAILQGMNLFNAFAQEKQDTKAEKALNALSAAFHITYSAWKSRNPLRLELFALYVFLEEKLFFAR